MSTPELRAAARELVARSTADQGLELTITDPGTLRRVAGILAGRGPARAATRTGRNASSVRSDTAGEVGRV